MDVLDVNVLGQVGNLLRVKLMAGNENRERVKGFEGEEWNQTQHKLQQGFPDLQEKIHT